MGGGRSAERSLRLHAIPAAVLVLSVLISLGAWLVTRSVVRDQQTRLLKERTSEVALVLNAAVSAVTGPMSTLGAVWQASGGSAAAFEQAAAQTRATSGNPARLTLAAVVFDPASSTFVVRAESGAGLRTGQVITGPAVATLRTALRDPRPQSTMVLGSGADRQLGLAIGPPAAPAGTVIYWLDDLGAVQAPAEASSAPFHELQVVFYASPRPDPSQVLASTAPDLVLHGTVRTAPVASGSIHWLVAASASQSLVGSVAANAPWVALVVALLGGGLVTALLEYEVRRRVTAVALYASERDTAEAFQRSLLPALPTVDGVEVAARYVAAQRGHEVGGDWFDVFELPCGEVGLVIGDVVGHDVVAATAMAQIRAALRAYALAGNDPAEVLERLHQLILTFEITPFVTVFYATLGPAGPDGSRLLRYANAGHLPPLIRPPGGPAELLSDGTSVVLGAPWTSPREAATRPIDPGTTLLLFTDGLIEVPGVPITQSLEQLAARLDGLESELPVEGVAAQLLPAGGTGIDDIALLALRTVRAPASTAVAVGAEHP
jgi:hypothetical protein